MDWHPPIERFLGAIDPTTGPFGVLGLPAREVTPEEVDAALARRIERIERHPQAGSAEADEVVLALHVAAAQVRDVTVQRAMLAQLPGWTRPAAHEGFAPITPIPKPMPLPTVGPAPKREAAPRAPAARTSNAGFRELALATLAHSGGWNRRSKRRVAGLAHTFGVSPGELIEVLADLGAERAAALAPVEPVRPIRSGGDRESQGAPVPRWLVYSTVALFVCAALLLTALVSIVATRMAGGATPVAPSEASAAGDRATVRPTTGEGASAPTGSAEGTASIPEPVMERGREVESALANLRRASTLMVNAPSEAERSAEAALDVLGSQWEDGDPVVVQSAVGEVSTLMTTAVRTDTGVAVRLANRIASIALGDGEVGARPLGDRVFFAGLAARLSRDTLTGAVESRFREALTTMSGDGTGVRTKTFGAGAAEALERAARGCDGCPSFDAIATEWIAAHAALEQIDADQAESAVLESLDALVRRPVSRETSAGIEALVGVMRFDRPGARSAIRVIGWFEDRTVPVQSLAVVSSALISSGAVPGTPLDILVSAGATEARRVQVRDALAARFGVPVTAPAQRVADRVKQACEEVLAAPEPGDPRDALRLAVRTALVHKAAAMQWVGRDQEAEAALAMATDGGLDARVDSAMQTMPARIDLERLTGPGTGSDGQWALRYAQASRNEDEKARLLLEIRTSSIALGPADADALAIAALGPNSPLLRKTAQRTLLMHALNPVVISSVTEAIPDAVSTDDVEETLEVLLGVDLPDAGSDGFRGAAARAGVARLLTMLGASIDRRTEGLHEVMREVYLSIAGADASADPMSVAGARGSMADPDRPAYEAARDVRASLRRDAARYAEGRWTFVRLGELDLRAAARATVPRTAIEKFVVEQLDAAEMLAYLVAAERPLASEQAARVSADMARDHLAAKDPMHQVLCAERAMVSLWMIRFGGAADSDSGVSP